MEIQFEVEWHSDGGHAWLEVSKEKIKELGLSKKISYFSYQNEDKVFLEEDSDALKFFQAYFGESNWFENESILKKVKKIKENVTREGDSPVRNYKRYHNN